MPITHGHSFLVYPGNQPKAPASIGGAELNFNKSGRLIEMLKGIYDLADNDSDVEITFRLGPKGEQENECRTLLLSYMAAKRKLDIGRQIAKRLRSHTTGRSKHGLLFLVMGTTSQGVRLVVARFPADEGVMADAKGESLSLKFIEQVFMKSSFHYKSVVYNGSSVAAGFWNGFAIDKQSGIEKEGADYWIGGFLHSNLSATAAYGAKWTAAAFRGAIDSASNSNVRSDLVAASQTVRGQHGRKVSIAKIAETLGLSGEAIIAMKAALPREELFHEIFKFDRDEYDRHVQLRMVALDNGATLIADNTKFDTVFQTQSIKGDGERMRFATEGAVVTERLRKRL
jgi:hypothetical protein